MHGGGSSLLPWCPVTEGCDDGAVVPDDRRAAGRLFDEMPELYDRVRPSYPDELFVDLAAITGILPGSPVLEVGCGTGQATRSLAAAGLREVAVEAGDGMAAVARRRFGGFDNVEVETSTFEDWASRGRRFDLVLAAASWHWVDPEVGWPKVHALLNPGGWMALIGNVVVRRPGEPEVYAATADLHEQYLPGHPDWRHPPLEAKVRAVHTNWGPGVDDPAAGSARRPSGGTRSSSGSTAQAWLTTCVPCRCIDG